jgi:hypothetical protein
MLRLVYPKNLNHRNCNLAEYRQRYFEFGKIYRKIVSRPTANGTRRRCQSTRPISYGATYCAPLETRLGIEHAPAFDETHELFYEA